jgi:hypothetical protein
MTDKLEGELKTIPPLRSQTRSPGELRSISMDEIDLLQVDRNGRLYWDPALAPVEFSFGSVPAHRVECRALLLPLAPLMP